MGIEYYTESNVFTIVLPILIRYGIVCTTQERRSRTEGPAMSDLVPGELLTTDEPVEINADRETTTVTVENTGDRPSQVGSHFHFFETNPALSFDRKAAYGMRLDIPAGTAIRFEPGCEEDVDLVAIGGDRVVKGMGGLVNGELDDDEVRERAFERAQAAGYLGVEE